MGSAWSSDDFSFEEHRLDTVQMGVERDELRIGIAEGRSVSVEATPDLEKMKAALGLTVSDEVRVKIEAAGGQVVEADPMEAYRRLSPENKVLFEQTRRQYLVQAGRVLDKMDGALGAGILIGDSVQFVKRQAMRVVKKPLTPQEKIEKQARKTAIIQSILQGLDYKLWSQAPLVIQANEFGLQASVGVIGLSGFLKKGGGGLEEIGLSLAFNKQNKAFVFEIFHSSERFDHSAMPALNIGINGKAGMLMVSRDLQDPTRAMKGSTFYPPAFPGSSGAGPELFTAGMSSGVGFPPPPLADFLTFTNKFERNTVIRVTVSPMVKGFVRVQLGDVKTSAKLITYRFVDIYNAIRNKVIQYNRASCQRVFAMP